MSNAPSHPTETLTAESVLPPPPEDIISVERGLDALTIRRRRNRAAGWIALVFGVGLLVPLLLPTLQPEEIAVYLLIFGWLIPYGLYQAFNTLTYTFNREEGRLTHGPLPWRSESFDLRDASQLFVRHVHEADGTRRFHLLMWTTDGEERVLMRLNKYEDAAFFEREIEDWLGIDDQRVPGEYRPTGKRKHKRSLEAIVQRLTLRDDPAEADDLPPAEANLNEQRRQ